VLGLYLCFLLIVCVLGVFEDIDEVFTLEESVELECGVNGELTVLTTFPDLLIIVTVSMIGILAVCY
jgi:hypothetical protein